jgi:hypothetical protein
MTATRRSLLVALSLAAVMAGASPPGQAQVRAASPGPWPNYHLDNSHSGNQASQGPVIGLNNQWTSSTLDGKVYAEPLLVGNSVLTVTENNTVYAIDTGTGVVSWSVHVATPVTSSTLPCGNISPVTGMTATPVVDTATNTLYAVGFMRPTSTTYQHRLYAINLATQALAWSVPIDAPGSNPQVEQERGALLLANGRIYVPFGGLYGDCGSYHGFVVSVSAADGTGLVSWKSAPNSVGAGIWAPSGPVADGAGNIYATTGNGFSGGSFDYGESVLKLAPQTLALQSYWAPGDWQALDNGDTDIGSMGPALLTNGLLFQSGKNGVGYLLRSGALGGIGAEAFKAQVSTLTGDACFGGTAFDAARIYVACNDGLVALALNASAPSFSIAWRSPSFTAGPPVVAGGQVWSIDTGSGQLLAFNSVSGAAQIPPTTLAAGVNRFVTPTVTGSSIYVPLANAIEAFTLTSAPVGSTWTREPGSAVDIGSGSGAPNSATWVVGTNSRFGGYGLWQWNGSGWTEDSFHGGGVKVAVDQAGQPWVVNSAGQIYQRTSAGWQPQPGSARDIGFGGGTAWVIGNNPVNGGYGVWQLQGSAWVSDAFQGGGVRLAVGNDGQPWVVNSWGAIYQRSSSGWNGYPGGATDLGIGSDGSAWVIGTTPAAGGGGIYRWIPSLNDWWQVDGGGSQIAVDSTGMPWVVNSSGAVYRRS